MLRLFLLLNVCLLGLSVTASAETNNAGSEITVSQKSEWNGYSREHFSIDGYAAWITLPKTFAPGHPWLWRARFPGFHDQLDLELLKRGYAVIHIKTENLYGSLKAMAVWDKMYNAVCAKYKLNPKGVLAGVSRGGLFIYNFAQRWPERVAVLYGDTPVMDLKSWPGGRGKGEGSPEDWKRMKTVYGFVSDSEALAYDQIPLNYAENLASHHLPIYHIVGPKDQIVPPAENTYPFAERYRKAGGRILVHNSRGPYQLNGHHVPLDDLQRSIQFIVDNTPLPSISEEGWVIPNRGINRAFKHFRETRKGRVLYLGGSITENAGWQNKVSEDLKERFPDCQFEFKNAGIGSHDSLQHAFRRNLDASGKFDLIFFEAAVNDLHNRRTDTEQFRGYEGTLRGFLRENPETDIICLHFAEPRYNALYAQGKIPPIIARHSAIANHYGVPVINLAKEVADRLSAKQFDWNKDFHDLHPSSFGQVIYYQAISKFFDAQKPVAEIQNVPLPAPFFSSPWENGKLLPADSAVNDSGFALDPNWKPKTRGETRNRYVNCPMWVGEKADAAFHLDFEGTAVGLFLVSSPDAAVIEYRVDNGPLQTLNTRTQWNLHLPFAFMLADELPSGKHTLYVKIRKDQAGKALRVWRFMVNG